MKKIPPHAKSLAGSRGSGNILSRGMSGTGTGRPGAGRWTMNKTESEIIALPFFVTGMRGKLGNRVYYMRNGKIRSRRHVMPSNPRTGKQRERRSRFADAVRVWRGLDADARAPWNWRARGMKMSGYGLFMREFMSRTAGVGDSAPRHARECLAFRFHMPAPCGRLRDFHQPDSLRKGRWRTSVSAPALLRRPCLGPFNRTGANRDSRLSHVFPLCALRVMHDVFPARN